MIAALRRLRQEHSESGTSLVYHSKIQTTQLHLEILFQRKEGRDGWREEEREEERVGEGQGRREGGKKSAPSIS